MNRPPTRLQLLRKVLADYWIAAFAILGGLAFFGCRTFLFEPFRSPSQSMEPTLTENTLFVVKKWGYGNYSLYGLRLPTRARSVPIARGDVLVFRSRDDVNYVKRIIGLPGDTVSYADRRLTINGVEAPLRFVRRTQNGEIHEEQLDGVHHQIFLLGGESGIPFEGEVPQRHYFMMGDSRANSRDSRYIGFIPESDIVGKVAWILYKPQMQDN